MWNRGAVANISKLQVYGHNIQSRPFLNEVSFSICVDTGAFKGRKLSAVIIDNGKFIKFVYKQTDVKDFI